MTKFVGKFRKDQDYKDDYSYAKNFLNSKKRTTEHPEIKKQLKNWEYEDAYTEQEIEKKFTKIK